MSNSLKAFKKWPKVLYVPEWIEKGDLGEFVEGQMVRQFEDAVWKTEVDEIPSKFIKTQFGYHIIWGTLQVWRVVVVYQDLNLGPSVPNARV